MVVAVVFADGDQVPVIALPVTGESVLELAGSVSAVPLRIASGMAGLNVGVTLLLTDTVAVAVFLQPLLSVPVTL